MSQDSSSSDVPRTLERRRSLRSSTPVKIGGVQFVRSPSPTNNGVDDACSTPFGPVAVGGNATTMRQNKFGMKQHKKTVASKWGKTDARARNEADTANNNYVANHETITTSEDSSVVSNFVQEESYSQSVRDMQTQMTQQRYAKKKQNKKLQNSTSLG